MLATSLLSSLKVASLSFPRFQFLDLSHVGTGSELVLQVIKVRLRRLILMRLVSRAVLRLAEASILLVDVLSRLSNGQDLV